VVVQPLVRAIGLPIMRRAKFICTVGPATESAEMLRKLVEAGTDVFRSTSLTGRLVNTSPSYIRRIRVVEEETGKAVAILQDLPGPKIRLGVFKDGSVELHARRSFPSHHQRSFGAC